eukprot:scaffold10518_cov68-Phaeocystis_antarctica.AAC.4
MLLLAEKNKTGFLGVTLERQRIGTSKPYVARVSRCGKTTYLGTFATAEEAALCFARSPEGWVAAAERAAAALPLTSEEVLQQAQAEGLTLIKSARTITGFLGVSYDLRSSKVKPYQAQAWRGGKNMYLGSFATAEEAALCVARSPGGQAAAERAAAALTSEEARQQAQAEGLMLIKSDNNKTGYFCVNLNPSSRLKPYQAHWFRGRERVHLGSFVTAEEAALCVARSPRGQAATEKAAAALTREEARQQAQAEGLMLLKSDNKTGYFRMKQAQVSRGRKRVHLGSVATAEEAALYIARSPALPLVSEDDAGWAAAQPHVASDDGGGDDAVEEIEEEVVEVLDAVEVVEAPNSFRDFLKAEYERGGYPLIF